MLIANACKVIDASTLRSLDVVTLYGEDVGNLSEGFLNDYEVVRERLSGVSFKDIAESRNCSPERARQRFYRGVRRISWFTGRLSVEFSNCEFEVLSNHEYKHKMKKGILSGEEFSLDQINIVKSIAIGDL